MKIMLLFSGINAFVRRNKYYVLTFLLYNYFYFVGALYLVSILFYDGNFVTQDRSVFTAIIMLPIALSYIYNYFFRFYLALIYLLYLVYKLLKREQKQKKQIYVSISLMIVFLFLYFLIVQEMLTEFPIPNVT
jgi:hypothetical protein